MFLTASSTPSLREKKIWQNAQTLWPLLWHDIPRFFVHFLEKQIFLLKHRKCKVCLPFQLLEIETGRQSNCFSYSTIGWASDRLVGLILKLRSFWSLLIDTTSVCPIIRPRAQKWATSCCSKQHLDTDTTRTDISQFLDIASIITCTVLSKQLAQKRLLDYADA